MDKEVKIERLRSMYCDQQRVVENAIEQVFGVTIQDIKSPSRVREIVEARIALLSLFRKHTPILLSHLGLLYNRHHSTVLYSTRISEDLCRFDYEYRDRYNRADEIIEEGCEALRKEALKEASSSDRNFFLWYCVDQSGRRRVFLGKPTRDDNHWKGRRVRIDLQTLNLLPPRSWNDEPLLMELTLSQEDSEEK